MPLTTYSAGQILTASSLNSNLSFAASAGGITPVVPTSVVVGSGTGTANANGQVTFSGASSISLNGVFTSTYTNYLMVLNIQSRSTTNYVSLRLRAAGTDTSSSSYYSQYLRATGSTVSANAPAVTTSSEFITSSTNAPTFTTATIFQPQVASLNTYFSNQSNVGVPTTSGYVEMSVGGVNVTTQFDGFTLLANTGNLTGLVTIYGMAN